MSDRLIGCWSIKFKHRKRTLLRMNIVSYINLNLWAISRPLAADVVLKRITSTKTNRSCMRCQAVNNTFVRQLLTRSDSLSKDNVMRNQDYPRFTLNVREGVLMKNIECRTNQSWIAKTDRRTMLVFNKDSLFNFLIECIDK